MILGHLKDHPRRYELVNELHARPFQPVAVPGRVLYLAIKGGPEAAVRDPKGDFAHLVALLDRFGAAHPSPGASHHAADLGRFRLKWERHTEFVTYTLIEEGPAPSDALFRHGLAGHLPAEWLEAAPGGAISAIEIELMAVPSRQEALALIDGPLGRSFDPESLVAADVIDRSAVVMGDFRVHEGGFSRFAVLVHGECGPRRLGRLVQRLTELATYQTMALLTLPVARGMSQRLTEIANRLADLIGQVADSEGTEPDQAILAELTALSAEIERMSARSSFRFGAAGAYSDLVTQRVESLREERVPGRQLFGEFTMRRFEPAMRTCRSVEGRLRRLAAQASRAAELLRTRVDVAVEAQNQKLLLSMDRRADLQLRLQETVEGLSVVAISYYAVSLAALFAAPFGERAGFSKETVAAVLVVPVVLIVWSLARRIRRRIEHARKD